MKIAHQKDILKIKHVIKTANKKSKLDVIGITKNRLKLTLSNNEKSMVKHYLTHALIIKNLALPVILSRKDLKLLKITFDNEKDEIRFPVNKQICTLPLTDLKHDYSPIKTICNIKIPKQSELCFVGQLQQNTVSNVLFIEPTQGVIPGISGLCSIDKKRKAGEHNYIHLNLYNNTNHDIVIKKDTLIAEASSLPNQELINKPIINTSPKPETPPEYTEEELIKRVFEDLNLKKSDLNEKQRKKICQIFAKHRQALALHPYDVGEVKGIEIGIDTGNHPPISAKPRPLPPGLMKELAEQINKWIRQRVIFPSSGPWSSPLVPVPKKPDLNAPPGTPVRWRFCVDYRKLNSITRREVRPVANLGHKLSLLKGPEDAPNVYFASADLAEAYHSVKIKKEDREKTTFTSIYGNFAYRKMSFGLSGAPAVFNLVVQKLEETLKKKDPIRGPTYLIYFDDVCFGAPTIEELTIKMQLFLEAVEELGLKIQPKKCSFGVKKLKWLGHMVSQEGLQIDPSIIEPLTKWKTPQTIKEVRGIHGVLSHFRKFVRNFAHETVNIRKCLKGNTDYTINWTDKCQEELQRVTQLLKNAPILKHPDFSEKAGPFELSIDTSKYGIGSELAQYQLIYNPETKKKSYERCLIAFGSRRLTQGESRYSAFKLELSGLVTSVHHFRYFLLGRKFRILTDSKALQWLMKTSNPSTPAQVFRWQIQLSEFDFDVVYQTPQRLRHVDAFSRKIYEENDHGNMQPPRKFIEPIWEEEWMDQATKTDSDDFWIPIFKFKKPTETVLVATRHQMKQIRDKLSQKQKVEVDLPQKRPETTPQLHKKSKPKPIIQPQQKPLTRSESLKLASNPTPDPIIPDSIPFDPLDTNEKPSISLPQLQLSWNPDTNIPNQTCQDFLKKAQQSDPTLTYLIKQASTTRPNWPTSITDGLLDLKKKLPQNHTVTQTQFFQFKTLLQKRKQLCFRQKLLQLKEKINGELRYLMVIPVSEREKFVEIIHHSQGSKHLGINKTITICSQYFYFTNLAKFVQTYIQKCKACCYGKKLATKLNPPLGATSTIPHERLKFFSCDLVQLPTGKNGYTYLFTMLDIATSWLEAFPLKVATADKIIAILEKDIFPRYHNKLTFICDNGRQFISKLLKEVVDKYQGRLYFGTSYHANSLPVERFHRTLIDQLRSLMIDEDAKKEEWPRLLPQALTTIRAMPGPGGFSAHYRVYGKHPITQASVILNVDPNQHILLKTDEEDRKIEEDVYPKKEGQEEAEEQSIKDFEDKIEVTNKDGNKRTLYKIKNYLCENICQIQEAAQRRKDTEVQKTHEDNKKRMEKNTIKWKPIKGELVDWLRPFDPDSMDSKKLAIRFSPLYVVKRVLNNFKCIIQEIDKNTLEDNSGIIKTVYIGDIRPSLQLIYLKRPHKNQKVDYWQEEEANKKKQE